MATRKRSARKRPSTPPRPTRRPAARRAGFVGRDPSPILDRYPPKDPGLAPRGPPVPSPTAPATGSASGPGAPPAASRPVPLLALERPFSVDEFAAQLGVTALEVTVPRDDLAEVLRRVCDFMGFGIYVYEVRVRPAPSELLKSFVVSLRRVDFRPERGEWAEFEEQGRSDSPFGPRGQR